MLADVPLPPAIAARPRDPRGYPVPAITPWTDGVPQFGVTSVERTFLCAVERRCSICATVMPPGPVWRVVGEDEAEAIAAAIAEGRPFRNAAPTAEAPGHRVCMLYAAMVCPYLSRPTARRGASGTAPGIEIVKGARRGSSGAVVGHRAYDFTFAETGGVLFRFDDVVEFLPHEVGAEHAATLPAAIARAGRQADTGPDSEAPPYLLADDRAAVRAFAAWRRQLLG